jgi:hypothetical protein
VKIKYTNGKSQKEMEREMANRRRAVGLKFREGYRFATHEEDRKVMIKALKQFRKNNDLDKKETLIYKRLLLRAHGYTLPFGLRYSDQMEDCKKCGEEVSLQVYKRHVLYCKGKSRRERWSDDVDPETLARI